MSTPPRRLKDDPDFLWETGCDMADEAFAVGGYDLPSLRARVLAGTQPPSGGAPLRASRGGSVGAAVAGALLLLGLGGGAAAWWSAPAAEPDVAAPTAPVAVVEPAPVVVVEAAAALPVQDAGLADEVEEDAPVGSVALEARAPVAAPLAPAPVLPVGDAGSGDAPIEDLGGMSEEGGAVSEPSAPASTLAAEVAMYDAAAEHLVGGSAEDAVVAYQAYLEMYPQGRLVVESQLGLLRSRVAVGASEEVEALSVQLLADPRLAAKHDDIARMRAENLVVLRRCDDAIVAARDLPSRDAAPIKRACRWKP